jgi:glutaconate CoA-transferase, subunit B
MTSRGDRVRVVVTDLGVLEPRDGELTLTRVHPQVDVADVHAATCWELAVASDLTETEPPTDEELDVLRALETRVTR